MPNNWHYIKFLLLMLPLFMSGSPEGKAKKDVTAVLTNINTIDVCGDKSKKEIIVVLDIGNVTFSDSLFAFNFELNYNQNKIKLHTALYLNTLSEFFEFREVGFFKGQVRGTLSVSLMGSQVAGNRPLIAFLGDYLDSCKDTSYVNLSYIEFTDEFQKNVIDSKSAFIEGFVAAKSDRILKVIPDKYSLADFADDSLNSFKLGLNYSAKYKIHQLKTTIAISDTSLFQISNINSLDSKVRIDSILKSDNKLEVYSSISDSVNKSIFEVKVKELRKKNDTAKLSIKTELTYDCHCFNSIVDTNLRLISKKNEDTVNVVEEIGKNEIRFSGNELILNEKSDCEIRIYNINGELEISETLIAMEQKSINLNKLNIGIYFLMIKNKIDYKKIILIKTNN